MSPRSRMTKYESKDMPMVELARLSISAIGVEPMPGNFAIVASIYESICPKHHQAWFFQFDQERRLKEVSSDEYHGIPCPEIRYPLLYKVMGWVQHEKPFWMVDPEDDDRIRIVHMTPLEHHYYWPKYMDHICKILGNDWAALCSIVAVTKR